MGNYYSGMMNATGGSELRHHGILGQKWGVRRFQNKDGTWTEAGKKKRRLSGEDRRVKDYFDRKGDSESFDRYESMDKSGKKNIRKAVEDLEGPHGIKGYYENAYLKSIVPPFKNIGKNLRNERFTRGENKMREAFENKKDNQMSTDEFNKRVDKVTNECWGYVDKYIKSTGRTNLKKDPSSILETKRGKKISNAINSIESASNEKHGVRDTITKLNNESRNPLNHLVKTKKYQNAIDNSINAQNRSYVDFIEESMKYIKKLPKEDQQLGYFALASKMGYFM